MSALSSVFLANIPSPSRGVWELGPIPIRAYALCILAGIVVAIVWTERRLVARGGEPGTAVDVAVWAVPFGLVGGRIYHVMTDWPDYFGEGGRPVEALAIWQGGLGVWGAIAFGAVGAWIGCYRRGVPLRVFADAAAPGIVVAQAIGRLGNWFNQELFGGETTLPWGLEIYQRVNADTGALDNLNGVAVNTEPIAVVHPTFLYELVWCLLVAVVLVLADRRFRMGHGRVFALYVAAYTLGRFFIESVRTDPASTFLGYRINMTTAAVLFLAAVLYLVLVRGGREVLSSPADTTDPVEPDSATTEDAEPTEDDRAKADQAEADQAGEPADADQDSADQDGAGQPEPAPERP